MPGPKPDGLKYDIGAYNRIVQLEVEVDPPTRNALNEETGEPKPVAERWARIQPLTGRELQRAEQTQSQGTIQVNFRHFEGLTEKYRLRLGKRRLNIVSIADLGERHYEQELLCIEQTT